MNGNMQRAVAHLLPGYHDLNGDGIMDALLFYWNGRRALFIADNGQLPWTKSAEGRNWERYFNRAFRTAQKRQNPWSVLRAHWGSYTLLVDKDNCGGFGSKADYCYRAFDINGDGAPEAEYFHLFPGEDWCVYSNKLHIALDGCRKMSYLDFSNLTYPDEQMYRRGGEYLMNVQGSGFFLNSYSAFPALSWEAPIAWYDFDFDGYPNMVMRAADTLHNTLIQSGPISPDCEGRYSGKISEFELAYELNGNTGPLRQHSLDLQLTFYDYETPSLDYAKYKDYLPTLAASAGTDWIHGEMADTRLQTARCYLPYMDGCKIGMEHAHWAGVFLLFDEDDDDCRWEEMFSTHEEPGWAKFADQIGDRTERDTDYGGGGRLYIGRFDGRIHLYHAEEGCWDVDYLGLYKGSSDHAAAPEGPCPPEGMLYPRVCYTDSDGDGFWDTIIYMTVAYRHEQEIQTVHKVIRLADYYKGGCIPRPELFDPRADVSLSGWNLKGWDGQPLTSEDFANTPAKSYYDKMWDYYGRVCSEMWRGAQLLYQTARRYGLNKSETMDAELPTQYSHHELVNMRQWGIPSGYSRHLTAKNRREQYHNGFWLREKVFADLCADMRLDRFRLEQLYYTGQYEQLCNYIEQCCRQTSATKARGS